MKPRKIKLFWTWGTVLLLLLAVAVTLTIQWPRLFPYHHTSDLYRHYAAQPGIDATFLKNFPVNDTLCLDVLLLEATDSAGWERLKRDFNIKDFSPEALLYIDSTAISFKYAPKRDHSLKQDSVLTENDFVVFSRHQHKIMLFDINEENQNLEIVIHQLKNKKTEL